MLLLAALVAALAVPASAGSGPSDSGPSDSGPSASSVPADGPVITLTVPDGYTALVDDTGVLAIVVPTVWDEVDTAPVFLDDRLTPSILAATDREGFVAGWDGYGASLIATPFATPDENIGRFTITSGCADGFTTGPFRTPADSPFGGIDEGLVTTASGCGPAGTGTWTIAAVSDAAQSYSLVLVVQTPTDTAADREAVAFVLDHFGATPLAVPTDLGVPSTAVPATERSAPVH